MAVRKRRSIIRESNAAGPERIRNIYPDDRSYYALDYNGNYPGLNLFGLRPDLAACSAAGKRAGRGVLVGPREKTRRSDCTKTTSGRFGRASEGPRLHPRRIAENWA